MKKSLKLKISTIFGCNPEFNKRMIQMKRSWDEVEAILCKCGKCKSKCCNKK